MAGNIKKPVIGVVGGIGSGKSTVAAEFGHLGCLVIDGDAIGHEVLGDEQVKDKILQRWGANVIDGNGRVDREALGRIAFSDSEELKALNRITHPHIRRRIQENIREAEKNDRVPASVLDAAVLYEAGWDDMCTHTVFVEADESTRRRRTRSQKGWSRDEWKQRENLQFSLDIKRDMCDYIIVSSSDVSHLRQQVSDIFNRIIRNQGHL